MLSNLRHDPMNHYAYPLIQIYKLLII